LKVVRHAPRAFLAAAQRFLERDEAANNLLYGLALSMAEGTLTVSATPILATVDDAEVVLVALRTPPHNLVLSAGPTAALEALAANLRGKGFALPGVIGPTEQARAFAQLWAPGRAHLEMSQVIMSCSAVEPMAPAEGRLRLAEAGDRAELAAWGADMLADPAAGAAFVARHLDERRLYVWDDGGPRSMAVASGPTPHGIRLSSVYTPPPLRNQGHARRCVAALTQRMLADGRRFCLLYADRANPASNAVYRRVGYRPVSDSAMWRFEVD
jgi:hypothetical protein